MFFRIDFPLENHINQITNFPIDVFLNQNIKINKESY